MDGQTALERRGPNVSVKPDGYLAHGTLSDGTSRVRVYAKGWFDDEKRTRDTLRLLCETVMDKAEAEIRDGVGAVPPNPGNDLHIEAFAGRGDDEIRVDIRGRIGTDDRTATILEAARDDAITHLREIFGWGEPDE